MIARQEHNTRYSLPDVSSVSMPLLNDMGETLAAFDLPLSALGTAHGS